MERKLYRSLKTPYGVQRYLDEQIRYNKAETCYSPRLVQRHGKAHCMEGALFAAAALRELGHPPLLVDLTSVRDDDHVLAVYRVHGHWGSVAKSNYSGLRGREPVYRSLRELAISYFEHYYNIAGEKTLRGYSRPVNLKRFDCIEWATADREVWEIPEYLCTISHSSIAPPAILRRLNPMDPRSYGAGEYGMQR
ncbi:hypothetical protein F183_A48160 [Bryobacterales bacterium F-183]|nr:hypothetical protein F183_A48160 [Bryobacterales bacterium F-183]